MRPQGIAVTVAALLGLAGCSSSTTSTPPQQVSFAALSAFCTDVGAYASELAKGTPIVIPAPNFVSAFYQAARRVDATDPAHPDMAAVAAAIINDIGSTMWPDVAKGQAYCVSAGAPVLSGAPSGAP